MNFLKLIQHDFILLYSLKNIFLYVLFKKYLLFLFKIAINKYLSLLIYSCNYCHTIIIHKIRKYYIELFIYLKAVMNIICNLQLTISVSQ